MAPSWEAKTATFSWKGAGALFSETKPGMVSLGGLQAIDVADQDARALGRILAGALVEIENPTEEDKQARKSVEAFARFASAGSFRISFVKN
jgi:hypothetical protein